MNNQDIHPAARVDLAAFDFQAQAERCKLWNDPEQLEALAMLYYQRGYELNALHCFREADACRDVLRVRTDLGMGGPGIELALGRVSVETEG